jgi:hypothetical protein
MEIKTQKMRDLRLPLGLLFFKAHMTKQLVLKNYFLAMGVTQKNVNKKIKITQR